MPPGSRRRRELLVTVGAIGGVLLLILAYTQTWPPVVVVESNSMMHPNHIPGWGRIGTIDPGDIVGVKRVTSRADVALWVHGGPYRYGEPGDVIIYRPDGSHTATPIIHRAITYIEVSGVGAGATYTVAWRNGTTLHFNSTGIYLPALHIDEPLYTPSNGWKPTHSGFLTKGDNAETNPLPDELGSTPLSSPVKVSWIEGKAVGELPWFGLLKLAISNQLNVRNPPADWVRIGNAFAPRDLWLSLLVSITAIVIVPLGWDVNRAWRRVQEEGIDPREPLEGWWLRLRGFGGLLRRRSAPPEAPGPPDAPRERPGSASFRFVPADEVEDARASGEDVEETEPDADDSALQEDPAPKRTAFRVVRPLKEDDDGDAEEGDD